MKEHVAALYNIVSRLTLKSLTLSFTLSLTAAPQARLSSIIWQPLSSSLAQHSGAQVEAH